jgi:hypothetical protein
MPAAKMTIALLEAHRGFQQDQDHEEANSAFLGLIDRGTKGGSLPWKEHRTYKTSPVKGQSLPAAASWAGPHMRIVSHNFWTAKAQLASTGQTAFLEPLRLNLRHLFLSSEIRLDWDDPARTSVFQCQNALRYQSPFDKPRPSSPTACSEARHSYIRSCRPA